jgi:TolB-like protein
MTEAALRESRLVVVLWSKASVQSDWVRSEATVALQRGALVPVMIEECQRPVMFELRQSADLIGWKGEAKDPRLVALLGDVARQLGQAAVPPSPVQPAARVDRRRLIGGAAVLAGLAGGGFIARDWLGGKAAASTSIAVLPFANLSGDPAQAYFADGIAEELRSALATIAGLKVAARTSSELMRDVEIKEAATKLGVAHMLTGSVRRGGGTIRVTAQLVDGQTGLESWSQVYDRPAGDVLDVQTGIASSVAKVLSLQFGKAAALVGGTKNPVAYDAFLRATASQLLGPDGYRAALVDIDTAIAADPNFALAHAFRALILVNLVGVSNEPAAFLNQTIAAANKAISIMPGLRLAHAAIGRAQEFQLDFAAADVAFAKAASLPPGTGRGIVFEARYQAEMGRQAVGLALADLAISLDPLNQVPVRNRAAILMDDRKAEAALALIEGWNRANPANLIRDGNHVRALLMTGRPRDALVAAQSLAAPPQRLEFVAIAQAALGNRRASDAALAQLQPQDPNGVHPFIRARVRAAQGEADLAFAELNRALVIRDSQLSRLRVDDAFDGLRTDPRFIAIERKLGFPPR